jgi:hypothetical protein
MMDERRQAEMDEFVAKAWAEQARQAQWRQRRADEEWMAKGRGAVSPLGGQAKERR